MTIAFTLVLFLPTLCCSQVTMNANAFGTHDARLESWHGAWSGRRRRKCWAVGFGAVEVDGFGRERRFGVTKCLSVWVGVDAVPEEVTDGYASALFCCL